MISTVLITGAGSKLVEPILRDLLPKSERVIMLTRSTDLTFINPKIFHIKMDLSVGCAIEETAELVIHLAGVSSYVQHNGTDNSKIYDNNVRSFLNLLNYCVRRPPQKLVFISTTDVYALVHDTLVTEATPTQPNGFYGFCKLVCEHCAKAYEDIFGLKVTILRLGPVYGPGMDRGLSVWRLLQQIWSGSIIEISNPGNKLSLLSTKNAAQAIVRAAEGPHGLYNIAGYSLTIEDFLVRAAVAYGRELSASRKDHSDRKVKLRFDLSLAREYLAWQPTIFDVETILQLGEEFSSADKHVKI